MNKASKAENALPALARRPSRTPSPEKRAARRASVAPGERPKRDSVLAARARRKSPDRRALSPIVGSPKRLARLVTNESATQTSARAAEGRPATIPALCMLDLERPRTASQYTNVTDASRGSSADPEAFRAALERLGYPAGGSWPPEAAAPPHGSGAPGAPAPAPYAFYAAVRDAAVDARVRRLIRAKSPTREQRAARRAEVAAAQGYLAARAKRAWEALHGKMAVGLRRDTALRWLLEFAKDATPSDGEDPLPDGAPPAAPKQRDSVVLWQRISLEAPVYDVRPSASEAPVDAWSDGDEEPAGALEAEAVSPPRWDDRKSMWVESPKAKPSEGNRETRVGQRHGVHRLRREVAKQEREVAREAAAQKDAAAAAAAEREEEEAVQETARKVEDDDASRASSESKASAGSGRKLFSWGRKARTKPDAAPDPPPPPPPPPGATPERRATVAKASKLLATPKTAAAVKRYTAEDYASENYDALVAIAAYEETCAEGGDAAASARAIYDEFIEIGTNSQINLSGKLQRQLKKRIVTGDDANPVDAAIFDPVRLEIDKMLTGNLMRHRESIARLQDSP